MPCENYREALNEAAASGAAPSRELRSHLDACASCRAAFTEELQLFAAIDSGMRVAVNSEVPVSLLPRVRAELDNRSVPNRSWMPTSAAIVAAAVLVAAVVFIRQLENRATQPNQQTSFVARNVLPADIKPAPQSDISLKKAGPAAKNRTARAVTVVRVAKVGQVSVLIPSGQKQAIDALIVSVQRRKVDGDVLLAEKPESALQELRLAPLDVSPIELKPLEDVSVESPSQHEKTSR
jgi:hypothetical protein